MGDDPIPPPLARGRRAESPAGQPQGEIGVSLGRLLLYVLLAGLLGLVVYLPLAFQGMFGRMPWGP